jgi:hypothetical protein
LPAGGFAYLLPSFRTAVPSLATAAADLDGSQGEFGVVSTTSRLSSPQPFALREIDGDGVKEALAESLTGGGCVFGGVMRGC